MSVLDSFTVFKARRRAVRHLSASRLTIHVGSVPVAVKRMEAGLRGVARVFQVREPSRRQWSTVVQLADLSCDCDCETFAAGGYCHHLRWLGDAGLLVDSGELERITEATAVDPAVIDAGTWELAGVGEEF